MEKLNKYKRWNTQLHLYNNMYWDFVLSQDATPFKNANGETISKEECLSVFIDFSNDKCRENDSVVSLAENTWNNAESGTFILKDYGFTGIDNGRILFDNTISNKEFYDVITKSYLENDGDKRLRLYPVATNAYNHIYPLSYDNNEKCYTLNGGFFQGFYKLFGFDYQVLPQYIENEWNLEFVLRPRDIAENEKTINSKNGGKNKGIFFYMGARAENKFATFYNSNLEDFESVSENDCYSDNYFSFDWDDDTLDNNKFKAEFIAFMLLSPFNCSCKTPCIGCNSYSKEEAYSKIAHECEMYFSDDYFKAEDGIEKSIKASDGARMDKGGYYEIETDNKFLTFDRTKDGLTTDTYKEGDVVKICGYKNSDNENKFLTYNRTKSGKTTEDSAEQITYDVKKDIGRNAFALQIKEDGSVGYRYMVSDCDNGYDILEEFSQTGVIKLDEWAVINAKFEIINGNTNDCGKPLGERKMRIMLYVNGNLVFISKELPEFNFRELDDIYAKQEGVPFNISLGGGTQGLSEAFIINERRPFNKILPLEDNFGGTFVGDIKSFKFYTCPLSYPEIKNNYLFEKHKI